MMRRIEADERLAAITDGAAAAGALAPADARQHIDRLRRARDGSARQAAKANPAALAAMGIAVVSDPSEASDGVLSDG